jgi:hypothetical protein
MLRIAIHRKNGVPVFEPGTATTSVSQDGGSFIFENYDTVEHQPAPDDAAQGVWCPTPIAAGSPLKPTPSILNTVTNVGNIPYTCQLDPELKGIIDFTA